MSFNVPPNSESPWVHLFIANIFKIINTNMIDQLD